jgi:hypothetical protein
MVWTNPVSYGSTPARIVWLSLPAKPVVKVGDFL